MRQKDKDAITNFLTNNKLEPYVSYSSISVSANLVSAMGISDKDALRDYILSNGVALDDLLVDLVDGKYVITQEYSYIVIRINNKSKQLFKDMAKRCGQTTLTAYARLAVITCNPKPGLYAENEHMIPKEDGDTTVSIRLKNVEKDYVQRCSEKAGFPSVSSYVRFILERGMFEFIVQ